VHKKIRTFTCTSAYISWESVFTHIHSHLHANVKGIIVHDTASHMIRSMNGVKLQAFKLQKSACNNALHTFLHGPERLPFSNNFPVYSSQEEEEMNNMKRWSFGVTFFFSELLPSISQYFGKNWLNYMVMERTIYYSFMHVDINPKKIIQRMMWCDGTGRARMESVRAAIALS